MDTSFHSQEKKEHIMRSFFMTDPITSAQQLLGWHFFHHRCEGIVVETEAYMALGDPACHTFRRPSAREFLTVSPAGTAYVYLNYGMHWLFNIVIKGKTPEEHGFVLLRGLRPVKAIGTMQRRRLKTAAAALKKEYSLCNGPGKLTQAFAINGSHHGLDLLNHPSWGFFKDLDLSWNKNHSRSQKIVATPRIGISQARERLWRFVLEEE